MNGIVLMPRLNIKQELLVMVYNEGTMNIGFYRYGLVY
jgi:hypothetical protein